MSEICLFTIIAIQWAIILRFYFGMKALQKINNDLGKRLLGTLDYTGVRTSADLIAKYSSPDGEGEP